MYVFMWASCCFVFQSVYTVTRPYRWRRWSSVLMGASVFAFYLMYNFVSIGDRSQHDIPDSRLQRQDRHGSYSSLSSRGRHSPDASLHSRNSPVPSLPRPRRHDHPDRERRERRDLKKVHQCCCLILRTLYWYCISTSLPDILMKIT